MGAQGKWAGVPEVSVFTGDMRGKNMFTCAKHYVLAPLNFHDNPERFSAGVSMIQNMEVKARESKDWLMLHQRLKPMVNTQFTLTIC